MGRALGVIKASMGPGKLAVNEGLGSTAVVRKHFLSQDVMEATW